MTCLSCADFDATGIAALYSARCIDCKARALANGPVYFASASVDRLTDEYRLALLRIFGPSRWKAGHQRVKAYAARINGGNA